MTTDLPSAPAFGDPCPIEASPQTLAFLARRRSASPQALTAPGPGPAELEVLLRIAARVPDHGKLAPWRFVILEGEDKAVFVAALRAMARRQENPEKAEAVLAKIAMPPLTVAVVYSPKAGKIPEWEQQLSAGAVCTTLLIAAQAMGFGANWITDWYAFDAEAVGLLRLAPGERVAGFVHLGTAAEAPLERVRPEVTQLIERWRP